MLIELLQKMCNHHMEIVMNNTNAPIPDQIRIIEKEYMDELHAVQIIEELKDIQGHLMLYYANYIPALQKNAQKNLEQ